MQAKVKQLAIILFCVLIFILYLFNFDLSAVSAFELVNFSNYYSLIQVAKII